MVDVMVDDQVPSQPYTYQEFPRMVYRDGDTPRIAEDQEGLDQALEAGWRITVEAPEPVEPDPEPARRPSRRRNGAA